MLGTTGIQGEARRRLVLQLGEEAVGIVNEQLKRLTVIAIIAEMKHFFTTSDSRAEILDGLVTLHLERKSALNKAVH
jgi:hypothetical protein